MIINHNLSADYANRQLGIKTNDLTNNLEKLSSGMRVNRGGDDASGLAVSEKLRSQIRGLNQAERNVENGVSFIQTTEGFLQNTQDILHRLRELSVQSANGIYTEEDRMQIQVEVSQLVDEINRIASHAQFNGMNMLTGAFATDSATGQIMQFQVGANMDQNERIYVGTMTAAALGIENIQGGEGTISIETPEDANMAIGLVDSALKQVSKQRADLGAYQNRFETASKGVAIAAENLQAAESTIRDVDMASEMSKYVKNQILLQSSTAVLAQANTQPQAILQLL
ncbi:MAG: flagellin [Spirochaetales bacterium]|uniref:Flagellin n=1 Tax=Candidatus Thalassospirochaeta sargassi TaxID=3119039 RepID=A0AAJ1MNN2_9SPIO|nr:flagellin [Spirochaetales bacterium]